MAHIYSHTLECTRITSQKVHIYAGVAGGTGNRVGETHFPVHILCIYQNIVVYTYFTLVKTKYLDIH